MSAKKKTAPKKKAAARANPLLPKRPAATKRVLKTTTTKPGHPGQPDTKSPTHDRKGSQLERERHGHPNSTVPHQGAARSNKDPKARSSKQQKRNAK
ncbi:MAG: hypothetical protein IPI81_13980 [Flavobacteriales bacterium]|nr:hypothetical protein [Flavobacteriales bacterium]